MINLRNLNTNLYMGQQCQAGPPGYPAIAEAIGYTFYIRDPSLKWKIRKIKNYKIYK